MRTIVASLLFLLAATAASAQAPSPSGSAQRAPASAESASQARDEDKAHWIAELSLLNMFDGNINHDPTPIRSYGFVPAASFGYESSRDPRVVVGYEIAANRYTGTDRWDRISHGLQATVNGRLGSKWRFEGSGHATWKGSSEDRELANEYGVSGRTAYSLFSGTRLIAIGVLRYKDYPDAPGTSGFSPYIGAKIDQRLPNRRRLAFGYKYEERRSHEVRSQYWRNGYSLEFSTPFIARQGRLTVGGVLKSQTYRRLIKVGGTRQLRHDMRSGFDATYEYPLSPHVLAAWDLGFERRGSNDVNKRFFAPSFGMNVGYRWE